MYSPRLNPDLVQRLHSLCRELEIPMTYFANGAMRQVVRQAEARLAEGQKGRVLDWLGVAPQAERILAELQSKFPQTYISVHIFSLFMTARVELPDSPHGRSDCLGCPNWGKTAASGHDPRFGQRG